MIPKPPKVRNINVPTRSSAEVQSAADEARRKINSEDTAFNWLTGGAGIVQNKNDYAATKMLSGG